MDPTTNRLLLKANRSLGSYLSQVGLVSAAHLDEANETFIARLREGEVREASLLRILIYDLQVLTEHNLLSHQLEQGKVGAFHLNAYQIQDDVIGSMSLPECAATWTLPIDNWHGSMVLATAYYLSDFVRGYWEEKIQGPVSWMICPFGQLDTFFEQREDALRRVETASANS